MDALKILMEKIKKQQNLGQISRHDKEGPVFITYEGETYPW